MTPCFNGPANPEFGFPCLPKPSFVTLVFHIFGTEDVHLKELRVYISGTEGAHLAARRLPYKVFSFVTKICALFGTRFLRLLLTSLTEPVLKLGLGSFA